MGDGGSWGDSVEQTLEAQLELRTKERNEARELLKEAMDLLGAAEEYVRYQDYRLIAKIDEFLTKHQEP